MHSNSFLLCFMLMLSSPLLAREKSDLLVMRNGDRLTCEIKRLDSDVLYISLEYVLGTISVNWSKVDHIESKQLFLVKTQDGAVYTGTSSTVSSPASRFMPAVATGYAASGMTWI